MDHNEAAIQALKEKILAKRQQIDFEENELGYEEMESAENRENPDVIEETKNFSDGPETAADPQLLKSISKSRQELEALLRQLDDLSK